MHLHKKIVYRYFESQSNWRQEIRNKSIAEVRETSDAAAEEANQSEEEPEIVTDEDENRKITAAEALTLQAPTPQNGQAHSNNSSVCFSKILSVFDHFVGLALKTLKKSTKATI